MDSTFDRAKYHTQKIFVKVLSGLMVPEGGHTTGQRRKHINKLRRTSLVLMCLTIALALSAVGLQLANIIKLTEVTNDLQAIREEKRLLEARQDNLIIEMEMEMRREVIEQRAMEIGMIRPVKAEERYLNIETDDTDQAVRHLSIP